MGGAEASGERWVVSKHPQGSIASNYDPKPSTSKRISPTAIRSVWKFSEVFGSVWKFAEVFGSVWKFSEAGSESHAPIAAQNDTRNAVGYSRKLESDSHTPTAQNDTAPNPNLAGIRTRDGTITNIAKKLGRTRLRTAQNDTTSNPTCRFIDRVQGNSDA